MTERLTEIINDRNAVRDGICGTIGNSGRYFIGKAIDKLLEYENAEEEGRLVVLPCDTVYFICDKGKKDAHVRTKSILDLLVYDINGIDKDGRYWSVKEEAEKALKETKEKQSE